MTDKPSALIAAAQASEATTELLRFHREGPAGWTAFGDVEVIEKLAEALLLACRIDLAERDIRQRKSPTTREYEAAVNQLAGAAANFIEGWAG